MCVCVELFLFSKPGHELAEGKSVTAEQLRTLSCGLSERLDQAATIVDKLAAQDWINEMGVISVFLYSNVDFSSLEELLAYLDHAGIDPATMIIHEAHCEDDDTSHLAYIGCSPCGPVHAAAQAAVTADQQRTRSSCLASPSCDHFLTRFRRRTLHSHVPAYSHEAMSCTRTFAPAGRSS